MVGGLALDRPRGGTAVTGPDLTGDQAKIHPLRRREHRGAVLYADAFFSAGEVRHKAGHVPDGVSPTPRQKAANGWGYVIRIGDQVFYDHGVAPTWFVKIFATRKAYIYILIYIYIYIYIYNILIIYIYIYIYILFFARHLGAARRLRHLRRHIAFIDNTAGANVADAVSRDDFGRALAEGWTRVHGPVDDILQIFATAAADMEHATTDAADELLNLAQGFHF